MKNYIKLMILGILLTLGSCRPYWNPEVPETGYLKRGYTVTKTVYDVIGGHYVRVYGKVTFTVVSDSMSSHSFSAIYHNFPNINTELYKDSIDIFKSNYNN